MKYVLKLVVFLLLFTSCKSKKIVVDHSVLAKSMSANKVVKKHLSANFNQKTIAAKLKVQYNNGTLNETVSVNLKMVKDEVIWLKASKIINLLKVKITPEKVQFYSPYTKKYFDGDFSSLEKMLGTAINFTQLQNLLLGQALHDLKAQKYNVNVVDNRYVLSPKIQAKLFDIFFAIHPSHFKLENQKIINSDKNQQLTISYSNYKVIEDEVFPLVIDLKATQPKKYTDITIEYKTVNFNTPVNTSFKIPSTYKLIDLK